MLGRAGGKPVEMRRGIAVGGRNAHQAAQCFAKSTLTGLDEGIRLMLRNPGFLSFVADIDLHQQAGRPAFLLNRISDGVGQARAVQGFDDVGHAHGLTSLVGLQAADDVHYQPRMLEAERWKFGGGFLHAVFAKIQLAGNNGRKHGLGWVGLGHGDQCDGFWIASRAQGGIGHAGTDALHVKGNGIGFGHG